MPPRKRPLSHKAPDDHGEKRSKPSSSTQLKGDTTGAGRPRRSTSNDAPQYKLTRTNKTSNNASDQRRASGSRPNTKTLPEASKVTKKSQPPKTTVEVANTGVKRRGRPPKASPSTVKETTTTSTAHTSTKTTKSTKTLASKPNLHPPEASVPNGARRGRSLVNPHSASSKAKIKPLAKKRGHAVAKASTVAEASDYDTEQADVPLDGAINPDIQYWLMKAEPESRIEKGRDVKFSIDDLESRTEPEGWDGKSSFPHLLFPFPILLTLLFSKHRSSSNHKL
jgi:hypothetical protein